MVPPVWTALKLFVFCSSLCLEGTCHCLTLPEIRQTYLAFLCWKSGFCGFQQTKAKSTLVTSSWLLRNEGSAIFSEVPRKMKDIGKLWTSHVHLLHTRTHVRCHHFHVEFSELSISMAKCKNRNAMKRESINFSSHLGLVKIQSMMVVGMADPKQDEPSTIVHLPFFLWQFGFLNPGYCEIHIMWSG